MKAGVRRLGTIVSLLAPPAAWAQLPPVGVPPGVVRFEVDADFGIWDDRFVNGEKETLSRAFDGSALGSALLPGLTTDEIRVREITGLAGYQSSLGRLTADVLAERNTALFGLSLGLTRSITIFGRMPLVRARVQPALALDPEGANNGFAPTFDQQAGFFDQFDDALGALAANLAAGAYDGDPAQRVLAEATLASGDALAQNLFDLLADAEGTSPFVPTASSEAGTAIAGRVTALQTTLAGSLGIPGFTAAPVLPADPVTEADVLGFVSDPFGPIGLRAGESIVSFRGDAEAGASVTLADKWDVGARRGGLRAAVEALVRFPTGSIARTDRLLALGTGDGQTDVEVRGTVDVGSGNWGARLEGGYNRQFAADLASRVAPAGQPFPGQELLTNVRRDPGDVVTLAVRPFYRLARTLALIGALEHQSRGEDEVTYATDADVIPGVEAGVLAEGTDASATLLSVGLTYANPGGLRPGGRGLPVDAGLNYERVLRASGGVVPDVHRIRAKFRVYIGVF